MTRRIDELWNKQKNKPFLWRIRPSPWKSDKEISFEAAATATSVDFVSRWSLREKASFRSEFSVFLWENWRLFIAKRKSPLAHWIISLRKSFCFVEFFCFSKWRKNRFSSTSKKQKLTKIEALKTIESKAFFMKLGAIGLKLFRFEQENVLKRKSFRRALSHWICSIFSSSTIESGNKICGLFNEDKQLFSVRTKTIGFRAKRFNSLKICSNKKKSFPFHFSLFFFSTWASNETNWRPNRIHLECPEK